MKVKMLVSLAGPEVSLSAGDVVDLPDDEAKRLIEADPPIAIPVAIEQPTEKRNVKADK